MIKETSARKTFVNGETESRDCRTKSMFFNAGVALIALSLGYLVLFVPRGWVPHDEPCRDSRNRA